MASDHERLNRYLNEALATERALITTLQAHIAQTPNGPYRRLLERHLHETRTHAVNLSTRIDDTGTSLAGTAVNLAHTAIGQAITLAKGPIDFLRGGTDTRERLLKNAKDECATEALEIATYDAIEALAEAVGDDDTAELARSHRQDEERMLHDLRAHIPALAAESPERRPALPIDGYDELNAGQIAARLGDLSQ